MTSFAAIPLQVFSVCCEIFFVLDNKFRIQKEDFNIPKLKCDAILEDILERVLTELPPNKLFLCRKAMTLDELRHLFRIVNRESLSFESDSFEKMFKVACAAVKATVIRSDTPFDLVTIVSRKMTILEQLIANHHLKEEVCRRRNAISMFYKSFNTGEMNRVKTSVLNSLRTINFPVSILIEEGVQTECGYAVPRKTGPNACNLGICSDNWDNARQVQFDIAGKADSIMEWSKPITIENLFSPDRVVTVASEEGTRDNHDGEGEFYNLSTDIGDDILFSAARVSSTGNSFRSSFGSFNDF